MILTRIFHRTRPAAAILVALLSGCATTGYHQQTQVTVTSLQTGSPDAALDSLERSNPKDKDLLYYLERGELQRMKNDYEQSRNSWLEADAKVRAWEDAVKTDPSKLMGDIGSFLVNDTLRRYDGRDYEKVFLSVRLALDHLALGNWQDARTEVKKMHEREAIIAEFRSRDLEDAKKQSEGKGLKTTSFKELDGYPVETLDDPSVRALKNAYESAFANYLAGFVYEALGETSLAAAGYRKSIEMRPGEKMLEDSLKSLDGRINKRAKRSVDTLIVVETGSAPAITSKTLPIMLPIPSKNGVAIVATPISWPVLQPVDASSVPGNVLVDGKPNRLSFLTNVDHMARKALADEMPGIILRTSVRAIAKGVAQKAVQENSASMGLAGSIISMATTIAVVVSEQADERTWRTLPAFYSVARVSLAEGSHTFTVGGEERKVDLSGPYALVDLRTSGGSLYLAQTPYAPPPVVAQQAEPKDAKVKTKAKPAPKSGKTDASTAATKSQ